MATEDAARGKPAATECAVSFKCLDRICRAAGEVAAARWKKRRDGDLIAAYKEDEQGSHERNLHDRRQGCRSGRVSGSGKQRCRDTMDLRSEFRDEHAQLGELQRIGGGSRVHDDVDRGDVGQQHRPRELAQTPFQAVSSHRGTPMLRHDEADARMGVMRKGSGHPNIEVFGAEPLPCASDCAELGATRDPARALECRRPAGFLTRRRTCSATGP